MNQNDNPFVNLVNSNNPEHIRDTLQVMLKDRDSADIMIETIRYSDITLFAQIKAAFISLSPLNNYFLGGVFSPSMLLCGAIVVVGGGAIMYFFKHKDAELIGDEPRIDDNGMSFASHEVAVADGSTQIVAPNVPAPFSPLKLINDHFAEQLRFLDLEVARYTKNLFYDGQYTLDLTKDLILYYQHAVVQVSTVTNRFLIKILQVCPYFDYPRFMAILTDNTIPLTALDYFNPQKELIDIALMNCF